MPAGNNGNALLKRANDMQFKNTMRWVLAIVAAATLVACAQENAAESDTTEKEEHLNIVLILADDLAWKPEASTTPRRCLIREVSPAPPQVDSTFRPRELLIKQRRCRWIRF